MSAFAAPVVAWASGEDDPSRPLVVLLHGRGSDETEIVGLAGHLPGEASYAAVRAPIEEGGGYAWFANRGIGRPVAESLAATMAWFRTWLDEVAPAGRPVVLAGFSGGAAFAGGLVLSDPARFAGAAILYGTLPFEDAGVPVEAGRLTGLPVFVAQGDQDHVIPAELLSRTWSYLLGASGAAPSARRDTGGHGLTQGTAVELAEWLAHRLAWLTRRGQGPVGMAPEPAGWPTLPGGTLPARTGDRPEVHFRIPQSQLTDTSPPQLQEALFARLSGLDGVDSGPSMISVPGARGLVAPDADGPDDAFLVAEVKEFAHLHPEHDGSLHVALPHDLAADAIAKGWAQSHMWAGVRLSPGFLMVYGPRDEAELDVVAGIVEASHRHAFGRLG
ncbi:luciferase family protein [Nocardioides piscis]|uniref:Phospholipase n=1 Tax=Nocardioides piscis TaxID=2714938 RepID=A0A6G7YEH0_9ACTN|nr:luciferase family protein [Nocardioides piscis]QIK75007.1 phospholipase [Nocardioides piscis]